MKANIESDNSVTLNLAALNCNLFRLLDPSIALRPRRTARNAFVTIKVLHLAPGESENDDLLVVCIYRDSSGQLC